MVKKFKFGLFVKILLFYICALLIPFLICGSFLTQHIMSSYKNEILDLNVNTTNNIRRMIDENIDDVDVIKLLIPQNDLIMDFIKNDDLSDKQKAYSAKQVAAEIEKYRIYKNSIRAIHLYSRASDCIITQNTYYTKEEYFDRFLVRSGTSFEEWCKNLEGSRRDSIPILSLMDYSSADDYNSVTTATIM